MKPPPSASPHLCCAWVPILLLILARPADAQAPLEKQPYLNAFAPLIGGTWQAEGQWSNGTVFWQQQRYAWGPGKAFVTVQTYGPLTPEDTTLVQRNEGIRAWDANTETMRFWEFDRLGGITEGTVGLVEGGISYSYRYTVGEETLSLYETWMQIDAHTFAYRVGTTTDGTWNDVYLDAHFKRHPD